MRKQYTLFWFFLINSICLLSAQGNPPPALGSSSDSTGLETTTSSPWATIELTGYQMKPVMANASSTQTAPKPRKLPLWIPIGGGIIAGSVTTYLLLDKEEVASPPTPPDPDPEPDSLVVRDDAFTIPCLPPFTIRPLLNDEGSGLQIGAIGPTGDATIEPFGTDALLITDFGANNTFFFSITVMDSLGNTATNNIMITIERPDIIALDDSYTTGFDTPLNDNVLLNDNGENINIVDFEPPTNGGSVSLSETGELTFTPDPDFFGVVNFTYTIEDDCQQQTSATVTISVAAPDCDFSVTLTPTSADCGLANGTVTTQITPENDYTYSWSNGATSSNLTDLPPGDYSLTITSFNGLCMGNFLTTVTQNTFPYILSATAMDGNCTGAGEITLELDAPAGVPLVVSVIGPEGDQQFVLDPGITNLSSLLNLFPGDYTIIVYPQNAGEACAQQTALTIGDNSPELLVMNDNYTTPFQTAIGGNLLLNDTGFDILLSSVDPVDEGTLSFSEDGNFNFQPASDFTGTLTFSYLLTDACGNTATGMVTITVGAPDCDFTVQLDATAANCGLADGQVTTTVSPEGTYVYSWSNGADTPNLTQLAPGDYQLTVTSNEGLCNSTFSTVVTEIPGNYIDDVVITPGNCQGGGNIELTLSSPATGSLILGVTDATGSQEFNVPAGAFSLNSLINVPAGSYTLSVYPSLAGVACAQLVNLIVPDNTPTLATSNDLYSTPFQTSVSGNVLNNDSGLQIELISLDDLVGGTATFMPNGEFIFTPAEGFTGMGGFSYTVQDACGTMMTANVSIEVGAPNCDFTVNLITQSANCGFDNGAISTAVIPDDEAYGYFWSTGDTDDAIADIPSGLYTLTVTSNSGLCSEAYSVFIPELPINYFNSTATTSGTCAGGGNIELNLSSPDTGILNGVINGPSFSQQISLPNGVSNLNEMFNLVSGNYNITLYPEAAGPSCNQSINLVIPDNTPSLVATNDTYTTPFQTPLSANVLDNDSGLAPSLISIDQISDGEVTFTPNGEFTFTPTPGFAGIATFTYTIEDDCGSTTTANVSITVQAPDCNFTVSLNVTPAACGLPSGSISTSIDPPGAYTYAWSTGANTSNINNLPADDYTLTVTSNNGFCVQDFMATVIDVEAQFVDSLSTAPGDCAGDGSIILGVTAPDNGNLVVVINGPSGNSELIIPTGFSDLGDLVNLPSGVYDLVIYPESTGPSCNEATFAEVADDTEPFFANDDQYMVAFQAQLVDNVLENDEGLLLQAIQIIEQEGGTVDLSSNGDFVFTPDEGATGTAYFIYSAMDACTEIQQATATIEIEAPDCSFSASFNQIEASCGNNDGTITAIVDPAGDNYTYLWSNGADAETVANFPAGEHAVTITDTNDGCPLTFTFTVNELPADYISDLVITTPDCNQAAEISFMLSSNSPGLYTLNITAPDGQMTEVNNLTTGSVNISDFIVLTSGSYTISAFNQNIGTDCTETISALLPEETSPLINLTSITQPSNGTATDGSFTFAFDQLSLAPYQVMLNNTAVGTTNGEPYTVENLSAGSYTAFVIDAAGCSSNIINVELVGSMQLNIYWGQTVVFPSRDTYEPQVVERLAPTTALSPYLQLTFPRKRLSYRLQLAQAYRYRANASLAPVIYSRFQLFHRKATSSGGWEWSTGPAWLSDPQLGWNWEAGLSWDAPKTEYLRLQIIGYCGQASGLYTQLIWKLK